VDGFFVLADASHNPTSHSPAKRNHHGFGRVLGIAAELNVMDDADGYALWDDSLDTALFVLAMGDIG